MTTVAEKFAPQISRPVFDFVIPESKRQWSTDPTRFAMRQTTGMEDSDAATEAQGDSIKYAKARIHRALVEVDGRPYDQALSEIDNWSNGVREALLFAFDNISCSFTKEEREGFIKGRSMRPI